MHVPTLKELFSKDKLKKNLLWRAITLLQVGIARLGDGLLLMMPLMVVMMSTLGDGGGSGCCCYCCSCCLGGGDSGRGGGGRLVLIVHFVGLLVTVHY